MDQTQDYQKVLDDYAKLTLTEPTPPLPAKALAAAGPLPPSIPVSTGSHFDIFKYAFFLSLIIFLGVVVTLGYNLYKQYFSNSPATAPPATSESPTPSVATTPTSTAVCQLNDKSYHINEAFPAADGCNTCTCGDDLTISCTEIDCSSSSISIPADWKTYEDKQWKYSVKYPSEWHIISGSSKPIIYLLPPDSKEPNDGSVSISLALNSPDIPSWFKEYSTINASIYDNSEKAIQEKQTKSIVFWKNGIQVLGDFKASKSVSENEFTQILSTFKFTDSTTSSIPADWKTYENRNLGFSLKYSSNWNLSTPTSNDNQTRIFFLHKDSQRLMIPGFSIEKTSKTPQEIMNPFLNEVATPDNKKAKPETITVSGIKATKMIFDTAEGGLISLIYLTYGGSQYVIDLPIYGDQLDVETTQILSTFKFL